LKVTVRPALALPKMHRVEVERSDLPLVRAWVHECVFVSVCQ